MIPGDGLADHLPLWGVLLRSDLDALRDRFRWDAYGELRVLRGRGTVDACQRPSASVLLRFRGAHAALAIGVLPFAILRAA